MKYHVNVKGKDIAYTTLYHYYSTTITTSLLPKILIINYLRIINMIYYYNIYLIMYLSDYSILLNKGATKLVFLFDKVNSFTTKYLLTRSKPKILQRVGINLNYKYHEKV